MSEIHEWLAPATLVVMHRLFHGWHELNTQPWISLEGLEERDGGVLSPVTVISALCGKNPPSKCKLKNPKKEFALARGVVSRADRLQFWTELVWPKRKKEISWKTRKEVKFGWEYVVASSIACKSDWGTYGEELLQKSIFICVAENIFPSLKMLVAVINARTAPNDWMRESIWDVGLRMNYEGICLSGETRLGTPSNRKGKLPLP